MTLPCRSRHCRWLASLIFIVSAACAAAPPAVAQTTGTSGAGAAGHPVRPIIAPLQFDTFLHAFGGAMSGFFAAAVALHFSNAQVVRDYPLFLPAVGLSSALTAGIAKETLDSTGFGDPQWSDIIHTLIGGVLTAGAIAAVELASERQSGSLGNDAAVFTAAGVSLAVPISAAFLKEIILYLHRRKQGK